jgi:hypothetical protein
MPNPLPLPTDATPLDSIKDAKLRKRLNNACIEVRELQEQITAMEARKKQIVEDEIRPTLRQVKLDKVRGEGWLAIKNMRTTKTISAEKLIENGVDMDVIEASTVKKETEIVQVRGSNGG